MESQRSTTIGIALIMGILFAWFMYSTSSQRSTKPAPGVRDTSHVAAATGTSGASATGVTGVDTMHRDQSGVFASNAQNFGYTKRVETPLFIAQLSGKGGSLKSFVLKNFKRQDKTPLDLVNQSEFNGGDVNLRFVANDGKVVDTKDLGFTFDSSAVQLGAGDSSTVRALYALDSSRSIEKIFHFRGNNYLIGIEYVLHGLQSAIAGYHYTALIENALPYAELRPEDESNSARGFAGVKGDLEVIDAHKPDEPQKKTMNGDVDFVGSRTQYFIQSLIAGTPRPVGADLSGQAVATSTGANIEKYQTGINLPITHSSNEVISVQYYLGPLDYERLNNLNVGLDQPMDFGWHFLVRPISIHLMLPFFLWLHSFISNWGLVIIVFSIMIKLITVPLSTGQMRSMRKMQVLQPEIAKIREKYKDDPRKLNEEMLKVYRTYGVNPAGGCLPMVLQMPILFALYAVLRNVISLRQAEFFGWIHDLSVPDALFHFGTKVPLLGDQLSGLTLLLGTTMFLQQFFTVTDPRQRTMAYIMPVIFTFMFNSLPSGVALYYFMFNIFGLAQQFYLTKIATPPTLESMKVDPKKQKTGGLMARLQEMEKQQRDVRQQQLAGKNAPPPPKKKK